MEALRPNTQRAKTAVMFIYIVMVLDVLSLISEYMRYNLLQASYSGVFVSEEETLFNDLREGIFALIYALAFITSGILFICWFRRAYYNLHLKTDYLKHGEGWAAGAWFVPIISLFRPYEIMKELYTVTNRTLEIRSPNYAAKNNNAVIGWWWALWIISSFAGNFVLRTTLNAESIDGLIINAIADMILSLMGIPLGLLVVKLIKDYSKMETLLRELPEPAVEPEPVVTPDAESPIEPAV